MCFSRGSEDSFIYSIDVRSLQTFSLQFDIFPIQAPMPYDSRPPSGITENWQRLVGDIDDAGSAILNQFFELFIEQKSAEYCVTVVPTTTPTPSPTPKPTRPPTNVPSPEPTENPTHVPTVVPTNLPTSSPTSLKICLRVVGPNDQFNGFYVLWPYYRGASISERKYWVDEHSRHKIYVRENGMFSLLYCTLI